ncbi:transformer-2 protein homolog alpha [Trichonephila inaurata madagascariensis]|uniref:Transformer-2 protein homolog alpha n=1 Tax=Trichonephila inaurata madagascariensis TaxID=2747483 RepID=A0A8X6YE37_9ARAC|nr:transformer-2 protein homolog alpha [Trichonephila inaurata madagascariensis]
MSKIIPTDINKTGGLPAELQIFVRAKVMTITDVKKGLVNGAIGFMIEIHWSNFRRAQMYEPDIPSVTVNFGNNGVHRIEPTSVQFPAKRSYGTAEQRMLPLILSWAITVYKMQSSTVDYAVIYLGQKLFAAGQAYVALSRVASLDGLLIEKLDCSKLSGKVPCKSEALQEMDIMSPSRGHRYRRCSRSRSRSPRHRTSPCRSYDDYSARHSSRYSPMSSRRRPMGNRDNPEPSRCLGVFGLSVYTEERELQEVFGRYGPIENIQVIYDAQSGRSRGFAFVYFEDIRDAETAKDRCNGREINGRQIRVDFSITKRAHTPTPGVYMGKPTYPKFSRHRNGNHRNHSPSPHYGKRRYSRSRGSHSPRYGHY